VTLVGILAADMSLHAGDYRAGERTFQLLTQAAGRAGRGALAGEVVIQTYQPEHYAVVHAASQDYEGFYEEEISYLDLMAYPPAAHMMAVLVLSGDAQTGAERARELVGLAKSEFGEARPVLIGPTEAFIGRISDVYRYVFYIKHRDYQVLTRIKDALEQMIHARQWNPDSVQFDFDPMNHY
ncbi:MAG: primosomal protein N', partial [Lachnospiraceae bacterium]|nr:primosomal protein N' [Lachnospiraceae bacterium]